MEKKEMSFIEIFGAAGKDLGKKLEKSNNGAMIMIAAEELTSKNFRFSLLLHTEKAGVLHSRPTQNQTYNTPVFFP